MNELDELKRTLIHRINVLNTYISELEDSAAEIGLPKERLPEQVLYASAVAKREALKDVLSILMRKKRS
jgi:hypothetical protein